MQFHKKYYTAFLSDRYCSQILAKSCVGLDLGEPISLFYSAISWAERREQIFLIRLYFPWENGKI